MADDPTHDVSLTEMIHQLMPLCELLGIVAVSGDRTEVVLRGSWTADRCTVGGLLHGGYLMALADSAGAACASFHLPAGASTSTVSSSTNFLRAVRAGTVTARSTPVRVGRSTIVVQTDVCRDDGELVVRTTQTQAVLGERVPSAA